LQSCWEKESKDEGQQRVSKMVMEISVGPPQGDSPAISLPGKNCALVTILIFARRSGEKKEAKHSSRSIEGALRQDVF
jgi:hypothetical protein